MPLSHSKYIKKHIWSIVCGTHIQNQPLQVQCRKIYFIFIKTLLQTYFIVQ